jgi:hypothetical protein
VVALRWWRHQRPPAHHSPQRDHEVIASTEHDDPGRDYFQAFAHRAGYYGLEEDLTAYQALVMESHATYQSAVVYYDLVEKAPLSVSRTEFDSLKFAVCYLFRSLVAYGSIFVARRWRQELADIKARLIEIDPDLDGSLDDV